VITFPSWETDIWLQASSPEAAPWNRVARRRTRGLGFVIDPFAPSRKRWSNGCRQLMLRIERTALERVLIDELGRAPKCDDYGERAPVER
jgi:hypothetical protein